ncbi:MAG: BON domain-containing protein [Gammaproteobacteria bacterium]|nr:BON domain-containing protein [Gammaproteobacteria bacterium]
MRYKILIFGIIASLVPSLLLEGCAATVIAVGAAAGTAIFLSERRTSGVMVEDQAIELKILNNLLIKGEPGRMGHVNVTSYNGSVLLTGEVPNEQARQRAAEIASKIEKVSRVYNELRIAGPSAYLTRSSDAYITSKIKTKLVTAKNTLPTRIKVVTENGVVYLMGLVKDYEAEQAIHIARNAGGVQRVVNLLERIPS